MLSYLFHVAIPFPIETNLHFRFGSKIKCLPLFLTIVTIGTVDSAQHSTGVEVRNHLNKPLNIHVDLFYCCLSSEHVWIIWFLLGTFLLWRPLSPTWASLIPEGVNHVFSGLGVFESVVCPFVTFILRQIQSITVLNSWHYKQSQWVPNMLHFTSKLQFPSQNKVQDGS